MSLLARIVMYLVARELLVLVFSRNGPFLLMPKKEEEKYSSAVCLNGLLGILGAERSSDEFQNSGLNVSKRGSMFLR